jgi:hypothetical protein
MNRQFRSTSKQVVRVAKRLQSCTLALALISALQSGALGQEDHSHVQSIASHGQTPEQARNAVALVQIVREATERFKDVSVAEREGYALQFGCVSGPDQGAMGLHFVNGAIVNSGVLDPRHPQIVIYEPTSDGSLKLIGADFLVFADAWNATHSAPPELMGQLFHLFESPNRFGLPAFYTLHVWAWKDNPNGAFVNWHPNVSCEQFGGLSDTSK